MKTNKILTRITLYITFAFPFFMGYAETQILYDSVIAVVNKEPITQSELINEFRIEAILGKVVLQEPTQTTKQDYLDRIINRKLVIQAAEKIGIRANSQNKKVQEQLTEIQSKYATDTDFYRALQKQEVEIEVLEKWLSDGLIYDEYYSRQFVRTIDRNKIDELAPNYFEANKSQFYIPATVTFKSIYIVEAPNSSENMRQNTKQLAEKIYNTWQQGESYDSIKENHINNEFVSFNLITTTIDTQLGAIVANIQPNKIKGPFRDGDGFRVVELVKKTAKRQKQFSEVKSEIESLIRQNIAETEFMKWLTKQKSKVSWYILNNALTRISGITIPEKN